MSLERLWKVDASPKVLGGVGQKTSTESELVVMVNDRRPRLRAVPKTSVHSRQFFAADDHVRAGERATVWQTGRCSWLVSSHSAGGIRCRERLRNHLGPLNTAVKVEGERAEIDPFWLPLPQFMDATSPVGTRP